MTTREEFEKWRSETFGDNEKWDKPSHASWAAWQFLQSEIDALKADVDRLKLGLQYYADGEHFIIHEPETWDTVSGEPPNLWEDESNTATIEDGSVAKHYLAGGGFYDEYKGG